MTRGVPLGACALALALAIAAIARVPPTSAQDAPDLVALHETAVYATVRVMAHSQQGSGWLLRQSAGVRPVVVTNRHLTPRQSAEVDVDLYAGAGQPTTHLRARVAYVSSTIDFAVLALLADPPATARPLELEPGDVRRGERVVLGGNPAPLSFQTTEGVVTGATPESTRVDRLCGRQRNCIVVDAASFGGSSGGPALNRSGRVVGMLWGGPAMQVETTGRRGVLAWTANPSFAYLIHARTIEAELAQIARRADPSR